MSKPPRIPITSASTTSSGRPISSAHMRGTTSLRIGSAPSERIASTCSETVMLPSSAVMPAPTRPPTMRAVSTGPSSRTSEKATTSPMYSLAPNSARVWAVCSARTMPVNRAMTAARLVEPHPHDLELAHHLAERRRAASPCAPAPRGRAVRRHPGGARGATSGRKDGRGSASRDPARAEPEAWYCNHSTGTTTQPAGLRAC